MSEPVALPRFRTRLREELRDHFPILFVLLMEVALLNYEVSNVRPEAYEQAGIPMPYYAATAVFPLFWVLLYYYFRARDSKRLKNRWRAFGLISAVAIGLPLLLYIGARPSYMPDRQIVLLYEGAQFVWLGMMLIHSLRKRGSAMTVLFFGICFFYGMLLENAGIIIGYFGESQYQVYLGWGIYRLPAPLATQVGWCIMFYVAISIAEYLGEKLPFVRGIPWRMTLLTTLLAVTLDLQIDPLASLSGLWWKWNHTLPGAWLGVPLLNFVAWFSAFIPFSYAYFHFQNKQHLTQWQRNFQILIYIPWMLPACLLIGGIVMAIIEGGFDGPTYRIAGEFLRRVMPY